MLEITYQRRLTALTDPVGLIPPRATKKKKNRAFPASNNTKPKRMNHLFVTVCHGPTTCSPYAALSPLPESQLHSSPNDVRPRTWLAKYWSPSIHGRKTPDGGFTGYSLKTPELAGRVCAPVIRDWGCDSEKTSDRKTRSGGMDGESVLNPYMYRIKAEPQRPKWRRSFFLSPEQILGSDAYSEFWTSRRPDVEKSQRDLRDMRNHQGKRKKNANKGDAV